MDDDVPILAATDWASEHNLNRRFSHRTRSVSISIPVSSIELNSVATNRVDFTGPLPSQRKTHEVQRQERDPVAREHSTNRNHKNEYLLRSGQLGMCNFPHCITCPTSCSYEAQLTSRVSQNDGVQHGGAKGWAREKLALLKYFTFGVMNPHAKVVEQWKLFVIISCCFALFVDPLFCFLLSVNKDCKCIVINWNMTKAIVVLRSMTDLIYLMHIFVKFRLAFRSPESKVVGAPEWVDHPRKIALNYLSRSFIFDIYTVLPVPQTIVLLILPNAIASLGVKNLLQTVVLVQYILRWNQVWTISYGGYIYQSGSTIFTVNLLNFAMAGHVFGSCWYLLGLERVNQCLRDKNASACFTEDGFPYGIYVKAVNLTADKSVITRYVYSLIILGVPGDDCDKQISTLAGNQTPSYFVGEVLFIMCIAGFGLVLFAILIGNMQAFVHSIVHRFMERSGRQNDIESWMYRRHLPIDLRRKIRASERYNWYATRGIKEELLIENFPEDLQRDVRRHIFKFAKKVRIFSLIDEPVLDTICERLRKKTYIKGGTILYRGGVVTKMIFIARGKMESMREDGNKVPLSEGDVCGEELLRWYPEHSSINGGTKTHRQQGLALLSYRTVKCLTNVEAYVIWADELEEVTSLFPEFLRNHRVQFSIRNKCPYWLGVAATTIQVAWRYRKKRLTCVEASRGHSTRPIRFDML